MATRAWATPVDHTSDAGFRAWGKDLNDNLSAVGLIQTTDTGQVNWTTATRPGVNSTPYYEIWRFNDSLQATAPIFIRLEFGTGSSTNRPRVRLQIGTGTNGAGTLTGTVSTNVIVFENIISSTITAYTSYVSMGEGYLIIVWKGNGGSSSTCVGFFGISRTVNATTGLADPEGVFILLPPTNGPSSGAEMRSQSLSFSRNIVYSLSETFGLFYGGLHTSSTLIDGNIVQAMTMYMPIPKIKILPHYCNILNAEISSGNTFELSIFGNNKRTFLNIGYQIGDSTVENSSSIGLGIIWE